MTLLNYTTAGATAAQLNLMVAEVNDHETRLATLEGNSQFVYKTADETVSASATVQDDDHLTGLTVVNGGIYTFEALLIVVHSTDAADIKVAFAYPSGSLCSFGGSGANNAALTGSGTSGSGEYIARQANSGTSSSATPFAGSTNPVATTIRGLLVAAGSGTFKMQWAQNAAGGTTTLKAYSWLSLVHRA
jgi:hypothetical protein